jgi:hypothetical protein
MDPKLPQLPFMASRFLRKRSRQLNLGTGISAAEVCDAQISPKQI